MRTTVALVEARPETIGEDYRRVLDLSGLSNLLAGEVPHLLVGTGNKGFEPGWSATPWQMHGILNWLGKLAEGAMAAAVTKGGIGPLPVSTLWQDILTSHQTRPAEPEFLRSHRHVSQQLHPALDTALPAGVQVPVGLAEGPVLVLTSPTTRAGWEMAGAAEVLQNLVTAGASGGRKAPAVEVTAEAVGVARELMPRLGAVLDGTLWGVGRGAGDRSCVARNVLLAGTDPVAVDAVALRLAGIEPQRVPWMRLCRDRGFGQVMPTEIQIVGRTDLLDLDFGVSGLELGSENLGSGKMTGGQIAIGPVTRFIDRALGRKTGTGLADTVWNRLYEEYEAGERAGMTGTL